LPSLDMSWSQGSRCRGKACLAFPESNLISEWNSHGSIIQLSQIQANESCNTSLIPARRKGATGNPTLASFT